MAAYKISGPARQDLRDIHDWIGRDDRAAANGVLLELRDAMEMLAGMPGLGHVRDDLADKRLRAWTVNRYVIVYEEADPLLVVRVLGGKQDFSLVFGG